MNCTGCLENNGKKGDLENLCSVEFFLLLSILKLVKKIPTESLLEIQMKLFENAFNDPSRDIRRAVKTEFFSLKLLRFS